MTGSYPSVQVAAGACPPRKAYSGVPPRLAARTLSLRRANITSAKPLTTATSAASPRLSPHASAPDIFAQGLFLNNFVFFVLFPSNMVRAAVVRWSLLSLHAACIFVLPCTARWMHLPRHMWLLSRSPWLNCLPWLCIRAGGMHEVAPRLSAHWRPARLSGG